MNAECYSLYEKAYKEGIKIFKSTAKAEEPYLPTMEAVMRATEVMSYSKQPLREIPLKHIVGTAYEGRKYSFTRGFYPIASVQSEFATKWINLCRAQMEEGINEAITVYEYLWRYYVIEGNKRVSVLKYLGASSYSAEITRIVPYWDEENEEIRRYYAYLDYLEQGWFIDIELSNEAKYSELLAVEKKIREKLLSYNATGNATEFIGENKFLNDNEKTLELRFRSAQTFFEKVFSCLDEKILVGDAFLEYLKVYGLELSISEDSLKTRIITLVPQLNMADGKTDTEIVLASRYEEPTLLKSLFTAAVNKKIVFVYSGRPKMSEWTAAHERGRLYVSEHFGSQIDCTYIELGSDDKAYAKLTKEAAGAGLVFVTTPKFELEALRFSLEYPSSLTLLYSHTKEGRRLHTYFGRYFEAVFLCGMAAGLKSQTKNVAYITPRLNTKRYSSDINAFALGVHSVSMEANIYLILHDMELSDEENAENSLAKMASLDIDVVLTPVISKLCTNDTPADVFTALLSIENAEAKNYLAAPTWSWEKYYNAIVKNYLAGGLKMLKDSNYHSGSIRSFWWGMREAVIDFRLGDWTSTPMNNMFYFVKQSLRSEEFSIFSGLIKDIDGKTRVAEGHSLGPFEILNMDWLEESIVVIEA